MFLPGYFYWLATYLITIFPLVFLIGFFINGEAQVMLIVTSFLWGLVVLLLARLIYKNFYYKAEEVRRYDQEAFKAIFDKLPLAIMIVDAKETITFINLFGESLLGLKREKEINKRIKEIACAKIVLDGSVSLSDFVLDGLQLGIVYQDVAVGALLNGKQGTVKLTTRIINDQEKGDGVLLILTDYSVEKFMEEQVRHNECLSVVGQMAAGICHEIRNPLQSIKGFIQLIQEKNKLDQDVSAYVEIMTSEINRISLIVKEFLQLARPSKIKFDKNDLNCLVRDVVLLINSEAILRNVVIEENYGKKIPFLMLDEPRIKQVLINILSNALAAMTDSGIIRVATLYDFHFNEWKIIISDNGVGMDQETLKQIGKPFFTTKEEGTGLGLAVSYRIIEEHGGYIMVDSAPGKGSTFTIALPELTGLNGQIRGFSA